MTDILPFSAACERNKDAILNVIAPYLRVLNDVLEIGSGTAQHAIYFANAHKNLRWQTSDQGEYLAGIHAQLKYAKQDNVLPPLTLDVNQAVWHQAAKRYSAIYTANTLHIMSKSDVQALFRGLPSVVNNRALLFIYGPFKYNGEFTSVSNQEFDASLRSRGCGSAIKDIEFVIACAKNASFVLLEDHKMPANNQLLIFRQQD